MAVPSQLLALLLCLWSLTQVCSFNLEPRIPIVKKGSPKSHFGYTVAQHQTILATASGKPFKKSWLLVGAPKDQNLQPGTNRSGALWKCPLTTLTTDCEQVKTDGFKDPESGLYNFDYVNEALAAPAEDEIKDDQWLGVTLKSQGPGGKVLVCAHRYMHKGNGFQWGFGLCYILTQTLDMNDYLEPCRGKPVNQGHQQYGFCQAGTSGLLLEDEAVLGVPGPYTWRGTVHTSNISDDFLLKDKTQYFGPVTENESPVDKYSYLGYSVTAGRFFGNNISYVGGAPRANETGQVVFFSREKKGESLLRVDLILQGEMFASSYGFEVLGVDINGDRRDDLIVGAPFYYTGTKSGAVYVYMNNDGGFKENHPYTKIEGVAGESRYGFSMTSLGDLNHDGYTDIAIGAPYEGRGAIYIYLGAGDGLLKDKDGHVIPSQVIHAEDMPGIPYDAFGYSLSGGMDLDGNGYPDLLTSSFCSDRVLLIMSRPIIDIQTEVRSESLENIDPTLKGCTDDIASSETCFSFDACFKMDNDAGTRTGLRLKYFIEEISDRPIVRVRFANNDETDEPSTAHRNVNLRPNDMGSWICSREIVYLLDGPRNILQPLKFKLSYEIIQREPRPVNEGDRVPDIDDYPILNQREALRHFDGTFAKDCGNDDVCVSDLHVNGRLDLQKHKKFPRYILRLGEQDTVSLHIEVTNTGEPAYQSTLLVTHHKALAFDPGESETGSHQCSSSTSTTQVQCSIGNPLLTTSEPLKLSFKESGFPFDSKFIRFTVAANSTSLEETPQSPLNFDVEVIKKAEISIIGSVDPEQAFYGGEVVGESAIKHMDQIGMEVTHKYVVDNRGPWRVDELQVEVLWPHQVENNKEQGKWLLYMTEIPTVDGIGECEIDPSYVNPLLMHRQPFPGSDKFTGFEVEGELETTNLPGPDRRIPDENVEPAPEVEIGGGGTKITKTVTTTKKVTSSTTLKKTSSKSSSSKDLSVATERTSQGFSSSSGSQGFSSSSGSQGFSSSSGSSSSSRFSSSGHTDTGPVDDEIDGSGYGFESGRQHGRTHSRVSRRVYSEDRSRFSDTGLGLNELDGNFDDEDGDVVSHHEESHSSTKTSPDGRTILEESHHESKKVTVKEGTVEDIPIGRWDQSGGHHRTYTATSGDISDTRFLHEEDRRAQEAGRRQSLEGRTSEGSGSAIGFDGSGQDWRYESRTHQEESIGREEPGRGRHLDSSGGSVISGRDETVRRTHSGVISSNQDETNRRTQSGDVNQQYGSYGRDETGRRRFYDGDSSRRYGTVSHTEETRRTHSGGVSGSYDRFNSSGQDSGAGFGSARVDSDHRGETSRTHSGRHDEDEYLRTYTGDSETQRGGSRIHYSDRRITDSSERNRGGSSGVVGYDDSSRTDGSGRFRSNWNTQGGIHRVTAEGSSEPTWQTDGHYGRVATHSRTESGRSGDREVFSSSDRGINEEHGVRDPQQGVSTVDRYSGSSDTRDSSGNQGFRRTYTYGHERTSTGSSRQINTGGYDRTEGRDDSRTDFAGSEKTYGTTRTHTGQEVSVDGARHRRPFDWDSSKRQGEGYISHTREELPRTHSGTEAHNRASWSGHTAHGGKKSHGFKDGEFDSLNPDENGTYTRVEVDPETGATIVYTKKVYSNWDRSSQSDPSLPHSRSRRQLSRVKREKEVIIKPQAVTDAKTGKTMQVVNLRCDGDIPTAKCFKFRCNIRNLGAKQAASIRIKSRLWNSTLVEDYSRVSYVSIKSKAALILPEDIRNDQDQSDDIASAETLAYPDLLDQLPPEEVPLWVILVSIFAGLLVLIIIVLILWKLGFFERKRPDPTLSGNLDKDANGY